MGVEDEEFTVSCVYDCALAPIMGIQYISMFRDETESG